MPQLTGEIIVRLLVFLLAVPATVAFFSYLRGHIGTPIAANAVSPLLILGAAALTMVLSGPPSRYSAVGILFFVLQSVALIACVVSLVRRSLHPAVFWVVWVVNILSFALFFYLSFLFQIWR